MSLYRQKLNTRTGQFNLVPSGTVITFKDGVADEASLPATGNTQNDARITADTGHLYVWDNTTWVDQGDIIDLQWTSIEGGPTSTPTEIDDAVSKAHDQDTDVTLQYQRITDSLDQNQDYIGGVESFAAWNHKHSFRINVAQTFTPTISGPISKIELYTGGAADTGNLIYRIRATDIDGLPTGPVLDEVSIGEQIDGWQLAVMNGTAVVTAGQKYVIEIDSSELNGVQMVLVGIENNVTDPFLGGDALLFYNDEWKKFNEQPTIPELELVNQNYLYHDFAFKVWVGGTSVTFDVIDDGFIKPRESEDALAPVNSFYISTDQGDKVIYKDAEGNYFTHILDEYAYIRRCTDALAENNSIFYSYEEVPGPFPWEPPTISDLGISYKNHEGTVTRVISNTFSNLYVGNIYGLAESNLGIDASPGVLTNTQGFNIYITGGEGYSEGDTVGGNVILQGGAGVGSGEAGKVIIQNANTSSGVHLDTSILSANRFITFPDKDGTFAMLDDIIPVINYTWRGEWVDTTTYTAYDCVQYNGSGYVSLLADNVGQNPETEETYWSLLVSKGDDAVVGGDDTQVQFNDDGALAGDAGLVFDKTTKALDVAGEISIKVYNQDTEPTLTADNRMAMWIDSNDNFRVYLVFKRGIVGSGYAEQVKIELA